MKNALIIALRLVVIMLGIGIFLPIHSVHANTQGNHQLKFQLTIDESLQDKARKTVTVPDEQVKRVGKNGTLVIEGYYENTRYVYLHEDQMTHLIAQNAFIQIKIGDIIVTIPTANFTGKHALTLTMERIQVGLPAINNVVGAGYDLTLKWGDQIVSLFEYGITLSFPVHDHDNPEELRVYYWNEELENWELVGGEYEDGYVHATTNHFSIFALFHPSELAKRADSNGGTKDIKQNNEQSGVQNGLALPKTATNTYNFIIIGIVLLVLGGLAYFLHRRIKVKT